MKTRFDVNYLEFHDAASNSHKFYRVTFHSSGDATIEWGRIGTAGQSQTKSASEAHAKLAEKEAKGYRTAKDPNAVAKIDPFTKIKSEKPADTTKSPKLKPVTDDIWNELAATGKKGAM